MDHPPKEPTAREVVTKVVEGGLGMIPIVGSPVAMAFGYAMGWAHNKRMDAWMVDLAEAVSDLQDKRGLTLDDLANDENFVDAVIAATRAAQATHRSEKLDALRNGVLNSLGPDAPDADEQLRFFRVADELTPSHLVLLRFLHDPRQFFSASGLSAPDLLMGGKASLLSHVPGFAGKREWYDLLASDLLGAGLANANLHVTMSASGIWQSETTPLGKRFLSFIGNPPVA